MALKTMVDAWAGAAEGQKAMAFDGAFAVRQIEVGLASMLGLLLGATATVYGVALLAGRSFPRWMGAVAVLCGVPTALGGLAIAYTGFSGLAMTINMPANTLLVVWVLVLGVVMWRDGRRTA